MNIAGNKPPAEFLGSLLEYVLSKIFGELNSRLDAQMIQSILTQVTPKRCAKLVLASQRMQKDFYREVYLELLRRDFLNEDVRLFLHDLEQPSEIGRDLARHNHAIRKMLKSHGIDPDLALEYPKSLSFEVTPGQAEGNINRCCLRDIVELYSTVGTSFSEVIRFYCRCQKTT